MDSPEAETRAGIDAGSIDATVVDGLGDTALGHVLRGVLNPDPCSGRDVPAWESFV